MRARDLGIAIGEGTPGQLNAITDVAGVRVGHTTLVAGDDVRTGVTVLVPPESAQFAGSHCLNGNGELTGLAWVEESGFLTTPIGLTNTFSVGVVRDALCAALSAGNSPWHLPVVGETWDGLLNDINGFHVKAEHVFAALETASDGAVAEGNVGGGTGMICHGFKGGIGSASRVVDGYTVGVLVQANHGRRSRLLVNGVAVGRAVGPDRIPLPPTEPRRVAGETSRFPQTPSTGPLRGQALGAGSIIVLAATDAPLLPHQCKRLAQRAALGIGRTGGAGENSSGDFVLAFATGNAGLTKAEADETISVEMHPNERIDSLFYAVVEATEEAIVNALLAAETMTGKSGTVHRLDPSLFAEVMRAAR